MENTEREQLIKALMVLKAARFIPHIYSNMVFNGSEYANAIEALVKLSGDNTIKEKATQYAVKWEERLKEKAEKDLKKSSGNGNNTEKWKLLGGAALALAAVGAAGIAGYKAGKKGKKKTGE